MPDRFDIVYRYDGSFEGLICCIYDSFYRHEQPAAILAPEQGQASLFDEHEVETDPQHAYRVLTAIDQKISPDACEMVKRTYLTCLEEKEMALLKFVRLGFQVGPALTAMLADTAVNTITKACAHMGGEAHLLKGFIRFSDYNGLLATTITPKNNVLPLIADHFCIRYSGEAFIIFDQTHELALLYHRGQSEIRSLAQLDLPPPSQNERMYRSLWKRFYDTIGIEGRYNPKCRMSHMPKRYWPNMTEFQDAEYFEEPKPTIETDKPLLPQITGA